MVKRLIGKGVNFKKILAGLALATFLSSPQVAYASGSNQQKEEESKKPLPIKLIVDGFYGEKGLKGAGIGIGYGPLSLLANYSNSKDKIVEELEVPLSNGRKGVGTVKDLGFNSLGIGLEADVNKTLFLGAGINFWNYTTSTVEEIVSPNGDVLKSNTDSRSGKKTSGRFYGGLHIPVSKALEIRVMGGYDTEKGGWGGIGGRFKLGKKLYKK